MAKLYRLNNPQLVATTADVVFIHGLNGDPHGTWGFGEAESWATWLDAARPDLQLWSLGYDAAASAWQGTSMPLVDRSVNVLATLSSCGLGKRPLCFLAHSMGGLVAKQLLREASSASSEYSLIPHFVRGIVFYSTPHSGSDAAALALYLRTLIRPTVSVNELSAHAPALRDLNRWFRGAVGPGLRIKVFCETQPLNGVIVVNLSSADPGIAGVTPIPVDCDHSEICKPKSSDEMVYRTTLQFLDDVVPSTLRTVATSDEIATSRKETAVIGRVNEIRVIERAIDSVASSAAGGRAVLLSGATGAGKSSLIDYASRYARSCGFQVARATCEAFNEGMSFYAVRELNRQLVPRGDITGRLSVIFGPGSIQTEIARLSADPLTDPSSRRDALIATFANLALGHSVSGTAPLLLCVDDLDRVDSGTADALLCLVGRLNQGRVLVVGAYRNDVVPASGVATHPLRPVINAVHRGHETADVIDVGCLPEDLMPALAEVILASPCQLSSAFVRRLFDETDGNPLYVREALITLSDTSGGPDSAPLQFANGVWKVARKADSWEIPSSVDDAIASRLVSLPDLDRSLLERAAVIGRRFAFDVLVALGQEGEEPTIQGLERQTVSGLLRELPNHDGIFEFTQRQVRDVLYRGLSGLRRTRVHGQIADLMLNNEHLPAKEDRDITIGAHLFAARRYAAAAPHLIRAGERAISVHASADAVLHFRRALDALEKSPDLRRQDVDRTRLSLGVALKNCSEYVAAESELKLVGQEGVDQYARRWALNHLGDISLLQGRINDALERFAKCETLARAANDDELLAETAADLAELHMRQAEQLAGVNAAAAALHRESYNHYLDIEQELAPTLQDRTSRARAFRNAAKRARTVGDMDRAIELYRQSSELVPTGVSSHQFLIPYAKALRLVARHEEALGVVRRVFDWSQQIGARRSEAIARQYIGLIVMEQALANGSTDFAIAQHELDMAVAIHQEVGFEQGRRETEVDLAELAAHRKDYAAVIGHLERSVVDGVPREETEMSKAVLAQLRANGEVARAERMMCAFSAVGITPSGDG